MTLLLRPAGTERLPAGRWTGAPGAASSAGPADEVPGLGGIVSVLREGRLCAPKRIGRDAADREEFRLR